MTRKVAIWHETIVEGSGSKLHCDGVGYSSVVFGTWIISR